MLNLEIVKIKFYIKFKAAQIFVKQRWTLEKTTEINAFLSYEDMHFCNFCSVKPFKVNKDIVDVKSDILASRKNKWQSARNVNQTETHYNIK